MQEIARSVCNHMTHHYKPVRTGEADLWFQQCGLQAQLVPKCSANRREEPSESLPSPHWPSMPAWMLQVVESTNQRHFALNGEALGFSIPFSQPCLWQRLNQLLKPSNSSRHVHLLACAFRNHS